MSGPATGPALLPAFKFPGGPAGADEKPRPRPRCVCVNALALSYCSSWSANNFAVEGGATKALGSSCGLSAFAWPLMPINLRNFSLVLSLPKLVDSHLLKDPQLLGFESVGWIKVVEFEGIANSKRMHFDYLPDFCAFFLASYVSF